MSGKVAFISGSAIGIGRATALAFAARGTSLALADLDSERGEDLAAEIREAGGNAHFFHTDMTDPSAIDSLFAAIDESFGRLDYAHNNVGFAWGKELLSTTVEDFDRTLDLCLKSPFLAMQHEVQMMRRTSVGSIVNTASMAGVAYLSAANAIYSAAKAGVIHLSAWAAAHHARDGIRVNAVSPGLVSSEAMAKFFNVEQQNALAASEQPIGRPVTPQEIAATVVFLCSDDAAMITGENICVSGGSQI